MDNNSFLNHLEDLCKALKEGNKGLIVSKLKQVEVYFADYKPDLWSIRIQGLLKSLFGVTSNISAPENMPGTFISYNKNDVTPETYIPELPNIHFTVEETTPLIFELIEKANIQLSTDEKNDILYLVRVYSGLTGVEGNMGYVSQFERGSNERLMDIMETNEALLRNDYNYFIDTINPNNVTNNNSLTIPSITQPNPTLKPETINLKNWIEFKKIPMFIDIEQGLFDKGFIDENHKWLKKKRKLIEFLKVISEYQFFREKVLAHKKQPFHYRQFISERYGYGKTGLTATSKEYKPTFEISKSSFFWIEKPI